MYLRVTSIVPIYVLSILSIDTGLFTLRTPQTVCLSLPVGYRGVFTLQRRACSTDHLRKRCRSIMISTMSYGHT